MPTWFWQSIETLHYILLWELKHIFYLFINCNNMSIFALVYCTLLITHNASMWSSNISSVQTLKGVLLPQPNWWPRDEATIDSYNLFIYCDVLLIFNENKRICAWIFCMKLMSFISVLALTEGWRGQRGNRLLHEKCK